MGAQIRVYRQKIASTSSMKKIFKAMELIATSRITKARNAVTAALPYANAITRAVSAVSSQSEIDHVLTREKATAKRSAVVVFTSDRGLAGSYSATIMKEAEELITALKEEGKEVDAYLVGRKAQQYYDFRGREYKRVWTGNTDAPVFDTAQEIGAAVLEAFEREYENGGVDEIHLVYTQFKSMVTQEPNVTRLLPLEVVEEEVQDESELLPLYDYEPEPEQVLDALLPRYLDSRIFAAMLQAAASELAARQRAMKNAGDNAEELIEKYTRLRNNARQAEITQELTEIVAGADSLGG
ncbi:F0F1 ATP synthase subunit gamma [Pseudoglutamicibacter albus]|uniref:ATP synthase gamma chain n=1 Tax=Pseudoglutamicibacter cumminsii TaxID=156979 RepID=A0AAP4FG12_9MICC|nr:MULTISPECIES: F0F1 ATP synthase subunit gamma [Pseudoglutamicibacter]MDK6274362.1 F0F1 ATP synthase subunit gamma [Pseudoglutamicibacter cumminsii]MDK7082484.1 F0F1 ATP synthase subunit gamma [Pseudoglutamicibacter cumminsii]PKY81119.1 F0F1 ATP synthase subunit gamma [Pseudoglutamicibacter albus]PWI28145.1 F0F1 ATP synthase subunit gamma [Pseudoglutamicibacter cumminsii]WIK84230.1 F0F1 ATP synthase subunit gamma [Pseudoglutamicibacter albus]